jgi:hypothetical protein
MELPYEIFEGDSTAIVLVRPNIADPAEVISDDWDCKVALIGPDDRVIVAQRTAITKSADNLYFAVQLSPAETELVNVVGLPVTCTWVIQVENLMLTPNYSKEKQVTLIVSKKGIA